MSAVAPRILVCDDHKLILEGLKRVLLNGGVFSHVGEVSSAQEAMAAVRREKWDLVILDISLGDRNGIEVLKEIRAEYPRMPVLILSTYPEDQYALRVLRAGARGYLNKNLAIREIVEAVRKILAGDLYISPKVAEQLAAALHKPDGQPLHSTLSDREDQVLRLIAAGLTVGNIAVSLALSVKTVSTYRAIVLRKLGLENNAQLMFYANEHGLTKHG